MVTSIAPQNVRRAKAELDRMQGSLRKWLKYRAIVDQVAAGQVQTSKPPTYAQYVASSQQAQRSEQKLATQLSLLLAQVYPEITLPNAELAGNADAAVQLAQIALGKMPTSSSSPAATGAMAPWVLPVIIASALLLGLTTAIRSAADVAVENEHYACIEAGACTDYGAWLKWGGIVALAWFAWEKMGVGDRVKKSIAKGGR